MAGEAQHGSVAVSGARLSYLIQGQGAPLLVLGSAIYYPRTFSQSLRQSCTLVFADLPHFVRLDTDFKVESLSFDTYAEYVEAIRAATGFERVAVLGHSHHGNLAVEYARRYPEKVSHLVLIGSPPVNIALTVEEAERYWTTQASEARKAALRERRRKLETQNPATLSPSSRAYISRYVADAPLYWHDPVYDASWLWERMTFSMDAIYAFRDLYKTYELKWDSKIANIPVLVVMGEQDYAVPHTLWRENLPPFANATFHLFKHSGHTPQLEQPDDFDRLLLNWLKESTPV